MINITKCIKRVVVSSCIFFAVSGYASDGLTPGPGIFSGESGEFNLTKIYNNVVNANRVAASVQSEAETSYVGATSEGVSASGYSAFKVWKELNAQNPDLYDNFEEWHPAGFLFCIVILLTC